MERLEHTVRTPESVEEYQKMKRSEKETAKDKGGFVGGHLSGGRSKIHFMNEIPMYKGGIPMAGRKPKPTALKELEGNPGKRKLNTKEPKPDKGIPTCPRWLMSEAKKEWKRLAEIMGQMGVLTEVDMATFAAYCQSYARWKEAQKHIDLEGATFETEKGYQQQTPWVGIANTNQKLMLQAASEFGLTPSSRSRIIASDGSPKELVDEMEALLGGTG